MTPDLVGIVLFVISALATIGAVYLFYRAFTVPWPAEMSQLRLRTDTAPPPERPDMDDIRDKLTWHGKPGLAQAPEIHPASLLKSATQPSDSLARAHNVTQAIAGAALASGNSAIENPETEVPKILYVSVEELLANAHVALDLASAASIKGASNDPEVFDVYDDNIKLPDKATPLRLVARTA